MSLSQKSVTTALEGVTVPGATASIVESGLVRQMEIEGGTVRVLITLPGGNPAHADTVRAEATRVLQELEGVEKALVDVRIMPVQAGGQAAPAQPQVGSQQNPAWADRVKGIKHIVAVASGKGGVGKSTVAANLALALARDKRAVALLDGDIYGPSQQMMMGGGQPMADQSGKIYPVEAPGGVKVMSLGLIIDPDQPVIWRGPLLMKALEQFIGDVIWGDVDDMVVDLPPGTGDIAITLCQNVPMAGAVIVTTPQDVALIDARKALAMFQKMDVPVLGIVENMSYYECPSCGHVEHIFGDGGGERTAEQLGVPFLGGIPIDPEIVRGGDSGKPIVASRPDSPAAKAFVEIARKVAAVLDQ